MIAVVSFWRSITGVWSDYVSEGDSQSYAEYRAADKLPVFDPVGASDISHRMVSNIDTSDRWIMFTMERSDFDSLLSRLADNTFAPTPLPWTADTHPPQNWNPKHEPPSWWPSETFSRGSRSVAWCYPADPSQPNMNHYGWFFLHDSTNNRVYCWHWCYQWAGEMCSQK